MTHQTKRILLGQAFVLVAIALLLPVHWSYRMVLASPYLVTDGCVAAIIAGVAATICLAGSITFWNKLLTKAPLVWYLRLILKIERWIVALLQLATMALAVAAAMVLIFHLPIPTHL